MSWTQSEINRIYAEVKERATTDKEFRDSLLQNPSATIEKFAGMPFPEGYSIKIIESDPNYSSTFVLPPLNLGELSDDDLDGVAGGVTNCPSDQCGSQVAK